jgi:hypothetical protein
VLMNTSDMTLLSEVSHRIPTPRPLCRAAFVFVHCVLQKNDVLPYGAIDCIPVDRYV